MTFIFRRLHALWSPDTNQQQKDNSNKTAAVATCETTHSAFDLTPKTGEFSSSRSRKSGRRFFFWRRRRNHHSPSRLNPGEANGQITGTSASTNDLLSADKTFSSSISTGPCNDKGEEVHDLQPSTSLTSPSTSPCSDHRCSHLIPPSHLTTFKMELESKLKSRSRGQSPCVLTPRRPHKNSNDTDEALTSTEDDIAISSELRSSQEDMADSPSPSPTAGSRQLQTRRYPPLINIRGENIATSHGESTRDAQIHPPEDDPALRRTPDSGMGLSMTSLVVSLTDDSNTVSPVTELGTHSSPRPMLDCSVAKQRIAAARPFAAKRRRIPHSASVNAPLPKSEVVSIVVADSEDKEKGEVSCTLQPPIAEETAVELQQTTENESSNRPDELQTASSLVCPSPQVSTVSESSSTPSEQVSPSPSIAEIKKLFTSKASLQSPPPAPGNKPSVTARPKTLPSSYVRPVSTFPSSSTAHTSISTSTSSTKLSLSPSVPSETSHAGTQPGGVTKKVSVFPPPKEISSSQFPVGSCGSSSVQNLSTKSPTASLPPPTVVSTAPKRGQVNFNVARRGSSEMLENETKTALEVSPQEHRRGSSTRVQDLVKTFQNRQ